MRSAASVAAVSADVLGDVRDVAEDHLLAWLVRARVKGRVHLATEDDARALLTVGASRATHLLVVVGEESALAMPRSG